MKVQLHNGLQSPQTISATRVLVLDDHGNPVAVAVEVGQGVIITELASEGPQFNSLLRSLGIQQTVIVEGVRQRQLPEISIPSL